MAPHTAAAVRAAIDNGRLISLAGRLAECRTAPDGIHVGITLRGTRESRTLTVGCVVNCTGPDGDVRRLDEPLIRSLLEAGILRGDALSLGIETDDRYRLLSSDGAASPVLFYVGPLLKAQLWESTAVPELREHAARVAAAVVGSLTPPTTQG
jgi:uncharacterized NAD(P)/FAD-binding protein YdhS